MTRGTPGIRRTRRISMRVSDAEYEAWEALRAASGRAEMGAWARAVVLDALGMGGPGSRVGDLPVVPEVNAAAFTALMGAVNNLNQLTRYSHQNESLAPGVAEAVAAVQEAALVVLGRGPGSAYGAKPVAVLASPGALRTGDDSEADIVVEAADAAGPVADPVVRAEVASRPGGVAGGQG